MSFEEPVLADTAVTAGDRDTLLLEVPTLVVDATRRRACEVAHAAVDGELDIASVGLVEQAVAWATAPGVAVVVDVGGVEFCDLAGARGLLRAWQQATAGGANFSLARPRRVLLRVFELAGLAAPPIAAPGQVKRSASYRTSQICQTWRR